MAIHLRYFLTRDGSILLPPTDETPCPPYAVEHEANTLAEVDSLQRRLQMETRIRHEHEAIADEATFAAQRKAIASNLFERMKSSACSEYEREFIRCYLELREEKRAKYRAKFTADMAYLEMRENDKPRNVEELTGEPL